MKRLGAVIAGILMLLFNLGSTVLAAEYEFSGQAIKGYPFYGKNTGLLKLEGNPPIFAYGLDMNSKLIEDSYYTSEPLDNDQLELIITHSYPVIKDLDILKSNVNAWLESKGLSVIAGLSLESAIAATQIAVWSVENGLDIGTPSDDISDELKFAHYLLSQEEADAPEPEIVIESARMIDNDSSYDATFIYYPVDKNGQTVIDQDKTRLDNLPGQAATTINKNGIQYIRSIKNIPAGTSLRLTVYAKKSSYEVCLLTNDISGTLVGVREATTELSRECTVEFPKIKQMLPPVTLSETESKEILETAKLTAGPAIGLGVLLIVSTGISLGFKKKSQKG